MCPQPHAAERTETRAGVRDVSLSLAPYQRFVSPLKTNFGRAASSLCSRSRLLRTTPERGRGDTRASGDARDSKAACACAHKAQLCKPRRHAERTETRAGVCDVSLSLAPYSRFVSPLKTNSGRAASLLPDRESVLRTTHERGRGGTLVSGGMRVAT